MIGELHLHVLLEGSDIGPVKPDGRLPSASPGSLGRRSAVMTDEHAAIYMRCSSELSASFQDAVQADSLIVLGQLH